MRKRGMASVIVVGLMASVAVVAASPPPASGAPRATAVAKQGLATKGTPKAKQAALRVVPVPRIRTGDEIISGLGDGQGWHLYAASSSDGWSWHPLATLRPAGIGADGERWTGRQCLTGDGQHLVAVVAPWSATNAPAGVEGGGVAYTIDAHTGAVRPLVGGVSLHYFTPSCGTGSEAALTRYAGRDEQRTVLVNVDAATAKVRSTLLVDKQVTAAVPDGRGGFLGVVGHDVVDLRRGARTVRAHLPGQPFDLVANARGGADLLVGTGGNAASIWQLGTAGARQVGEGTFADLALFSGRNGRTVAAGATKLDSSAGISALPGGAVEATSLDGGASAPAPIQQTKRKDQEAQKEQTPLLLRSGGGGTRQWLPDVTAPATTSLAAPLHDDATVGKSVASAFTSTCAVARNDVHLQVMQPSPDMVDWAANLAGRGLLSGAHSRPAGFDNLDLPAYSPSGDFPIPMLHGTNTTVPREVLEAIFAQESNFKQASPHSIEGLAGNPYVADYYGASGGYQAGVTTPDCGYGLGQVTTGMTTGAMPYDLQRKVAVDYAEDVAASAQILAQKWNQLADAGITVNDGDPAELENWYLAAWAYNSGLHPNSGSGPWGLGWLNNPANPAYPYNRHPFLHQDVTSGVWQVTYDDASHPGDWPYQEKIFGWMEVPIIDSLHGLYSYSGTLMYSHDGINDQQPLAFELNRPATTAFCDLSKNECDPSAVSSQSDTPCQRSDLECWWHHPISWCVPVISPCHGGSWTVDPSAAEPAPSGATEWYPPTCDVNTSEVPTGSVIVDSQPDGLNLEGCDPATANWHNAGSFSRDYGDPSHPSAQATDMDLHQLGTALGGHMWFTHTGEPTDSSGNSYWGFTGTWAPNLDDGEYEIKVFIPATGATTTQAPYTVNDASGDTYPVEIDQENYTNEWVSLGTYELAAGSSVSLTNLGTTSPGDIAFSGMAFIPRTTPPAPTAVRAFPLSTSGVHLNWSDLSDGTASYEISDDTTSRFTGVGATSFDWIGLAAGAFVCLKVRAVTSAGHSDWRPNQNNPACSYAAPAGSTPPPTATNVTASVSATTSYAIHLIWTDNSSGARYEISNGSASLFTSGSATSFDWSGLRPGTHMCFRVRASNFNGMSAWSPSSPSTACATTPATRTCQATAQLPDSGGYLDLYHGTSLKSAQQIVANGIDLSRGSRYVDFGKGFYVTTDLDQARRWAKENNEGGSPYVLHYRIPVTDFEPGKLCGLVFPDYGGTGYLAYVLAMRTFQPPSGGAGYDFTEGPLLMNPFAYITGNQSPQLEGQQDSIHSPQAAALLNAEYKEMFPA